MSVHLFWNIRVSQEYRLWVGHNKTGTIIFLHPQGYRFYHIHGSPVALKTKEHDTAITRVCHATLLKTLESWAHGLSVHRRQDSHHINHRRRCAVEVGQFR
jgi:hypothetical protein